MHYDIQMTFTEYRRASNAVREHLGVIGITHWQIIHATLEKMGWAMPLRLEHDVTMHISMDEHDIAFAITALRSRAEDERAAGDYVDLPRLYDELAICLADQLMVARP